MKLPGINMITQQEFCDHIEEDDFLLKYGNPVAIKTDEGKIRMAIEYYERMTGGLRFRKKFCVIRKKK